MQTSEFILEIVKVMIPVLTGLLAITARGIGAQWQKKSILDRVDYLLVILIAGFGLLSFGFWSGALAGAVINSAGQSSKLFFITVSAEDALLLGRECLAYGYNTFVITAGLSGYYYLRLLRSVGIERA